jgi:NAD(P)-dependent dehydrogenase (short-subunit alcohol dehydrogenase family)
MCAASAPEGREKHRVRTIAVTGSASGIGAAIRARLEREGARVIGVDLRDCEVIADLSNPQGRTAAIAAVERAAAPALDALVTCAGLGPHVADHAAIVSVNYFGAQALLAGLRPSLARGAQPAAVAISSNSATLPGAESPLVDACLAGDEPGARALAATLAGHQVYAGSKLALTRWLRRAAPQAEWAAAGIRLNAVAPGPVQTPLLQAGLDHPLYGPAIRDFPVPAGGPGTPADVAAAVAFLLGPEARYVCGNVLFVDGGTDALVRGDCY